MTDPPVLRIDLTSAIPAYRQIAAGLRAMLVGGELEPGDRLPTIRELAVDLGLHKNTVAEAYRLLAEEGWLALRRHHGATVLERPTPAAGAPAETAFTRHLRELVAEALAAGVPPAIAAERLRAAARGLATDPDREPLESGR